MERRRRKEKRRGSAFRGKVRKDVERSKQQASQYGYLNLPQGVSMFSIEAPARVRFDILPYEVKDPKHPDRNEEFEVAVPGSLWYKRPFKVHRNVGVENKSEICPTSIGKPCPICEYRAKRIKEGADREETSALKPSTRNLYIVVPKGHDKFEEKPHLWEISQFLFQNLLNEEIEENEDYEVFPDLKEGLTLRVRWASRSLGSNSFAEASKIDFEERDYEYEDAILEQVPNLDDIIHNSVKSYKELQQEFFEVSDEELELEGNVEEDEDNEDDVPPPPPPPTFTKHKTKGEDKEPEDDDEEEPEPEPTPKPKRKSRPTTTGGKNKCPYGYEFGVDVDQYDECDKCKVWDDCIEESERNG